MQTLIANIEREFLDVIGPPMITLSVARGLDDHREEELEALAREQSHHTHWKYVTKVEMSKYTDTWAFMDCEAFRFYLPAFMVDTLTSCLDQLASVPAWMDVGFYNPQPHLVECFSAGQKRCLLDFLELVHASITDEFDKGYFRQNVLQRWKNILVCRANQTATKP